MSARESAVPPARHPALELIALAGLVVAIVSLALIIFGQRPSALEEDERDYLRAATHLADDGVLAHSPLSDEIPKPDAYREPAYSWLVSTAWRLGGCDSPADEAALPGALARSSCTGRAISSLNLLLFGTTVAAAALSVRAVSGSRLAALAAAALVAASPTLRHAANGLYSENLATPIVTLVSALLAAWCAAQEPPARRRLLIAATAICAIAPFARSALLLLPVAGAVVLLAVTIAPEERLMKRTRRASLFLACALLPAALWVARNHRLTGVAAFADSRCVAPVRAELDRQIAHEGALVAALAWTPLESAHALARRLNPAHTFDRYEWTGEGNFYTRAWRARRDQRSSNPLATDRSQTREAFRDFLRHPVDHLRATAPVAWRGVFAERAPGWTQPLDGSLLFGFAFGAAYLLLSFRSRQPEYREILALLLPTVLLFIAHAFLTENLTRYNWPALPIAWVAVVLLGSRNLRQQAAQPAHAEPSPRHQPTLSSTTD